MLFRGGASNTHTDMHGNTDCQGDTDCYGNRDSGLHKAAEKGDTKCLAVLLQNGADTGN